jgi:hypothetical protein
MGTVWELYERTAIRRGVWRVVQAQPMSEIENFLRKLNIFWEEPEFSQLIISFC